VGKSQYQQQLNWQTTDPRTSFMTTPGGGLTASGNSPLSGITSGTMSGTNTIYSSIMGIKQVDNIGVTIGWSGTPTGTITYYVSSDGIQFDSLTNSSLPNPSGSAAFYSYAIQIIPFQFFMIAYTNSTGTGALTGKVQFKSNNQ
jgi:hypothetical protein